jgi:hypothetical protein
VDWASRLGAADRVVRDRERARHEHIVAHAQELLTARYEQGDVLAAEVVATCTRPAELHRALGANVSVCMAIVHTAAPGKERHLPPPGGDALFIAAADLLRQGGMRAARLPDGFTLPGEAEHEEHPEHDEHPERVEEAVVLGQRRA